MPPAEPLRETVVRVEAPRHRFTLLVTPAGDFLGADAAGLVVLGEADDRVLWGQVSGGYRHAATGRDAILQAVTPPYIMPFADSGAAFKTFVKSSPWQEITDHERRELESLMVYEIVGRRGRQAITVDDELTERRRAGVGADSP